jgi:hypothetical protein
MITQLAEILDPAGNEICQLLYALRVRSFASWWGRYVCQVFSMYCKLWNLHLSTQILLVIWTASCAQWHQYVVLNLVNSLPYPFDILGYHEVAFLRCRNLDHDVDAFVTITRQHTWTRRISTTVRAPIKVSKSSAFTISSTQLLFSGSGPCTARLKITA